MGHIDPMHVGGFHPPMSAEIAAETKKKLKETRQEEEPSEASQGDSVLFSEQTQKLPEKKKEAFMADAKREIGSLDVNSENFMEEAAERLVDSALTREYGSKIKNKPEYRQMNNVIKRQILMDPRYRPIIEEFLGKLLESEDQ